MKAYQSSARHVVRNFIRLGMFLLAVGTLGIGIAVLSAFFVLGDFSGAWQTGKVAGRTAHAKGLVPVRYVEPQVSGVRQQSTANAASVAAVAPVPAPLVAAPADGDVPVRVARALPVGGDIPVRRAQPVLLAVQPRFDARASVADDQSIPVARAVPAYRLAASSTAQANSASLNW